MLFRILRQLIEKKVEDHKWVIHEEIPDAGEEPFKPGDEVTINGAHMEGMDGVTAEIASAEETTVYLIDFTPTTGGEVVTNHKWVTESELSPAN
jgi:transcription antitermination factor NusG